MFKIDSNTKQEAVNYATLLNVLNATEHRVEPMFNELAKTVSVGNPLTESLRTYGEFFHIALDQLQSVYEKTIEAFTQLNSTDEIIKRGNDDYPPLLAETPQAPRFLYIRGNKSLLYEKRTVALVGSRMASVKAKDNTRRLAKILGQNGITVVSGLAKGIDVSAHTEALKNGFNTIAVIGTHLNKYYPAENRAVQVEIEQRGLVISQFAPASNTQRWFFPLRNGVMSGLSLATVIMEAGETSGALRQADYALKQGRQIIIPQNVLESQEVTWPKRYIEKGAEVARTPLEVLEILTNNHVFERQVEMSLPLETTHFMVNWVDAIKSTS